MEELGDEIASLAARMSAAMCRWLTLVTEFDQRRGWATLGCVSCAHWVSWRCGVTPVTAREHVRIAGRLGSLPLVRDAFARGELSYSKVRALARVDGIRDEAELLELARHASAAQLERIVAAFRGVTREEADAGYLARTLDVGLEEDGSVVLRGRLPGDMGRVVLAAIQAAEAALERERREDAPLGGVDARVDRVAAGARRADALVWLAQTAMAAPDEAGRVTSGRGEIVVHVDAETLTAADSSMGRADLGDGQVVAAETVRRLCCDAGIVPVVEGPGGEVLDVGRRTRSIPPALRRALTVRDGGCRFPGCDRTMWLQAHHVAHWAHGGETKLSNLVLLCHHHHQLVHEGGWVLSGAADGQAGFDAVAPCGTRMARTPPPTSSPDVARDEAGPDPGPEALFPLSSGAPWDLGDAVDALLEWTAPTKVSSCP